MNSDFYRVLVHEDKEQRKLKLRKLYNPQFSLARGLKALCSSSFQSADFSRLFLTPQMEKNFVSPGREALVRQGPSGTCYLRRGYVRPCHTATWVEMVYLCKTNRKHRKLPGSSPAVPCLWSSQSSYG